MVANFIDILAISKKHLKAILIHLKKFSNVHNSIRSSNVNQSNFRITIHKYIAQSFSIFTLL